MPIFTETLLKYIYNYKDLSDLSNMITPFLELTKSWRERHNDIYPLSKIGILGICRYIFHCRVPRLVDGIPDFSPENPYLMVAPVIQNKVSKYGQS